MSFIPGGLTNAQLRAATVPITQIPTGATYLRRFGINTSIGAAYETVDSLGVVAPYMPSTPLKFEVLSSSANDTAAGSGARTVEVTGIDSNWALATEIVTLNGVTPVQSVGTYYRVSRVDVVTVGTYGGVNDGDIRARGTGGGSSFVLTNAGDSQSFSSQFCVPLGYYGAIAGANFSTDSGKIVSLKVVGRVTANAVVAPFSPIEQAQFFEGITGVEHFAYSPPILLGPATDVWLTAKTAAGTASVSVEYWGWYAPL